MRARSAALSAVEQFPETGFETTMHVSSTGPYFALQALGSSSQTLTRTPTIATPRHLALYGRSVFVNASSGVGGVPSGCYVAAACHVVTTGR